MEGHYKSLILHGTFETKLEFLKGLGVEFNQTKTFNGVKKLSGTTLKLDSSWLAVWKLS